MDINFKIFHINPKKKMVRTCLCCQKSFKSTWIGNRLCYTCSCVKQYIPNYRLLMPKQPGSY